MDTKLIFDLILFAAILIGLGGGYAFSRGHKITPFDVLLFALPAAASIYASWWLFERIQNGGEADAYPRLLALLALLVTAPVASAFAVLLLVAVVVSFFNTSWFRIVCVVLVAIVWLSYPQFAHRAADAKSVDRPVPSRLGGEEWALESGASSYEACDQQSTDSAFRSGCKHQVDRMKH